jgi:hypothetical protein
MAAASIDEDDDVMDIKEDEGDSDEDSDDDGVLFQQPTILMGGPAGNKKEGFPKQPPAHLSWQQDAIVECFQLAVHSHDKDHGGIQDIPTWNAPPFFPPRQQQSAMGTDSGTTTTTTNNSNDYANELSGWEPKVLQLPSWAANLQEKSSMQTT